MLRRRQDSDKSMTGGTIAQTHSCIYRGEGVGGRAKDKGKEGKIKITQSKSYNGSMPMTKNKAFMRFEKLDLPSVVEIIQQRGNKLIIEFKKVK